MKVLLAGYGKMGKMIEELLKPREDVEILGMVHPGLFDSPWDVPGRPDVVVDFSYPGNLPHLLARALDAGAAAVIGTTGLLEEDMERMRAAAWQIPIVFSANYSLGVAVLRSALERVGPLLFKAGFDAEIIEAHHNQQVDAPSRTAKSLLAAIDPDAAFRHICVREGIVGARKKEIGLHAVRGGTVAGEHRVCFFGTDEMLEFRHEAMSRRVFAAGAVRAMDFVAGRAPGLYTIDDVLGLEEGQP